MFLILVHHGIVYGPGLAGLEETRTDIICRIVTIVRIYKGFHTILFGVMESNLQRNKRILNNSIALYFRMLMMMLISLFTVRVVLKVLGVEEYGIFTAIGGVVSTFSFISSVLANASQRFFAYEFGKDEEGIKIKVLFNTMFVAYILVSLIIILLAESVGYWFVFNKMIIPEQHLSAAHWIFHFSLYAFILTILTTPFKAVIIAVEKMRIFAYFSILESILKLLIVYMLLIFGYEKLKMYAVLTFVSTVMISILYIYESVKVCKLSLDFHFEKRIMNSIVSYSSWTVFGTVSGILSQQGINILLNIFYGPLANAAFAISSRVSSSVQQFSSNFYTAVRPPLIKSYSSNDFAYMKRLYYFSTKGLFSLVFIFLIPIYFETETILNLWLGQIDDYMTEFTRLSLVYTLVLTLSNPISTIAQAANRVKLYHGLCDSVSLLVLPISYILLSYKNSPYIPFLVSIFVFIIVHFVRLFVLKRIVGFKVREYISIIILPILLTTTFTIILALFIKQFVPLTILGSVISGFSTFIISCLSVLFIILNKNERKQLLKLFRI